MIGVKDKLIQAPSTCEGCAKGKSRRKPKPRVAKSRAKVIHGRIFTDISIVNDRTIGGHKHWVLFLDDKSRWGTVRLLKSRGQAAYAYRRFAQRAKAEGHVVQILRSDNEPTFLYGETKIQVDEDGTTPEATTPHSSYQNGPAERRIQTTDTMAAAMLKHAGAPRYLWGEAVHAANVS